jgi:predicted  nucleic acid-binding Zn-ribbon protein
MAGVGGPAPEHSPTDLRWQMSYDRASVDRFVAEVEEQRRQLQAQVDAAREDLREARAAAARRAETQAQLAATFLDVQRELEEGERAHREQLASIDGGAADAAAGVLAAALASVDALRAATSVAAAVNQGGR